MAPSLLAVGTAALACVGSAAAKQWYLQDSYDASNFFDKFDFVTEGETGFAHYQNKKDAFDLGLAQYNGDDVYLGVDHKTILEQGEGFAGRPSVRIESKAEFNHGLFIARFSHLPETKCGTWPGFFTFGAPWPTAGGINIYNGAHDSAINKPSLHTGNSKDLGVCRLDGEGQTAPVSTDNCDDTFSNAPLQSAGQGCSAAEHEGPFATPEGGVYAVEWTNKFIKLYSWKWNSVPANIDSEQPNTDSWGAPSIWLKNSDCEIDDHFVNQRLALSINLCGAGAWTDSCQASTGAASCADYVSSKPADFANSYFKIKDIRYFKGVRALTKTTSFVQVETEVPVADLRRGIVDSRTISSFATGGSTTSTRGPFTNSSTTVSTQSTSSSATTTLTDSTTGSSTGSSTGSQSTTGSQTGSSTTGSQTGSSTTGSQTGSSTSGTQTGSSTSGTQTGSSSSGTQTGSSTSGTQTGSSSSGTQTGSSTKTGTDPATSSGTQTGSSSSGTQTGSSSSGTQTGSSSSGTQTGSSSSGTQTGSSSSGTQTGSSSSGTQTGSSSGTQTGSSTKTGTDPATSSATSKTGSEPPSSETTSKTGTGSESSTVTKTGTESESTKTGSTTKTGTEPETTKTGTITKTGTETGPITTSSVEMTTSTVYTTITQTVTKCPPGHPCTGVVITKTVPWYTTVCPVTATPTGGPETITETITKVYTITACPPEVKDCPIGKVVTKYITTTYCPGGEKPTAPVDVPAEHTKPPHQGDKPHGPVEVTQTVTKGFQPPAAFTPEGKTKTVYQTIGDEKPSGFNTVPASAPHGGKPSPSTPNGAVPSKGTECNGEECPEVVTAGAAKIGASVAVVFGALVAMMI